MSETVRLCKDCRHRMLNWSYFPAVRFMRKWAMCDLFPASASKTDLVTGYREKPASPFKWCSTKRYDGGGCGPEGKLWEPRP